MTATPLQLEQIREYLTGLGIKGVAEKEIVYNATTAALYEYGLNEGGKIASNGALVAYSGEKTGRSPKEKRICEEAESQDEVWWGNINMPITERTFAINEQRALDYLSIKERLYIVDAYAGWDGDFRFCVRVVCTLAYHALFMSNMLILPRDLDAATGSDLASNPNVLDPDCYILNAGEFPANPLTTGMTSSASVDVCLSKRELVILGTMYAGEMKKGVFSLMHYLQPKLFRNLSLHSSCNTSADGSNVSLFFGLSGTGKTTLSADVDRILIGDDEHVWTENGIFNIEGGCYAKCIDLDPEQEPLIYDAIKFGAILENVILDGNRDVEWGNTSITLNTRASYPVGHVPNAAVPGIGDHPNNIILLTCDCFGVLPPISILDPAQLQYHFVCAFTSKVAGAEVGISEPQPVFSPCFGAPFLILNPSVYAELLAEKSQKHGSKAYLVNTGWSGGPYGIGKRMSLKHTRAIIDAIHSGYFDADVPTHTLPLFGLKVPDTVPGTPDDIHMPRSTWEDPEAYDQLLERLANLFRDAFQQHMPHCSEDVINAGPH